MKTAWKVLTAAAASGALLTAAAPSATPDTGRNLFTVRVSLADYHVHDARPDGPSMGDTSTHVAWLIHQGERVGREVLRSFPHTEQEAPGAPVRVDLDFARQRSTHHARSGYLEASWRNQGDHWRNR
jgi:hypothetical protein